VADSLARWFVQVDEQFCRRLETGARFPHGRGTITIADFRAFRGIDRKGRGWMPKFIVEREIPGASGMTQAELREAALKSLEVLRQLGPEIQWLHSYITDDKVYCIYFAVDEKLIHEHLRRGGSTRIDRIEAVRWMLDPINYDEQVSPDAMASSICIRNPSAQMALAIAGFFRRHAGFRS
jgi:hypothetical protein